MSPKQKGKLQQRAEWICIQLASNKSVSLKEFTDFCSQMAKEPGEKSVKPENLASEWSKLAWGIASALTHVGYSVSFEDGDTPDDGKSLKCPQFEVARYKSDAFLVYDKPEKKKKIGNLVAFFLREKIERRSVFLGSGSTVFWVGRAMFEQKVSFEHLFYSINIPLICYWAELSKEGTVPPVKSVKIPEGSFQIAEFRYGPMRELQRQREVGVAVVGADGCRYDPKSASVSLYANSEDVGNNTNSITDMAVHAVVVCLTSDKISEDPGKGPGPTISGRSGVTGILVTDEDPGEAVVNACIESNWFPVWNEKRFDLVPKKGQNTGQKKGRESI